MSKAGLDFLQILTIVFEKCNIKEIQLFMGIARKIWMRRNDVVHGNPFAPPNDTWSMCTKKFG